MEKVRHYVFVPLRHVSAVGILKFQHAEPPAFSLA